MPGVVIRGPVEENLPYPKYREYLRFDFWYACAYCSISETESQAVGFNIDHFQPRVVPFDGTHSYGNLMWSCVACNLQKGDMWESEDLQEKGFRFLRLDEDDPREHYELKGLNLEPLTVPGKYTLQVLNLNRGPLLKLRDLRARLAKSNDQIALGLQSIKDLRLDRLAPQQRQRYINAANLAKSQARLLRNQTEAEAIVRVLNHSPLIDPDPSKRDHAKARREYLKSFRASVATKGELEDDGGAD